MLARVRSRRANTRASTASVIGADAHGGHGCGFVFWGQRPAAAFRSGIVSVRTAARRVRDRPSAARTQSSIAVSTDYTHWFLFNASPDIRAQIDAFPALWPRGAVRHTPIQGIVLSDAEMDHTLGLLSLREMPSPRVYATASVYTAPHEGNPILRTLAAYCQVDWRPMTLGEVVSLRHTDGADSGLRCQAFATLTTKHAIFAADAAPPLDARVGYRVVDARTDRALVYLPAVQELNAGVRADRGLRLPAL